MELEHLKDNASYHVEEHFMSLSDENFKSISEDLTDEEIDDIESYCASLRNWIDNFEWDGIHRRFDGTGRGD